MKCPYCKSQNTEQLDTQNNGEKYICRNCEEDFIIWYDEQNEIREITDRHNRVIKGANNE